MSKGRGTMSALELIELGDLDRQKSWLNEHWPAFLGVTFGLATGATINGCTRRPFRAGIHKYFIATIIYTTLFQWASDCRDDYNAEKDMVMRHYVELHPKDFPPAERRKIVDIFEEWAPVR